MTNRVRGAVLIAFLLFIPLQSTNFAASPATAFSLGRGSGTGPGMSGSVESWTFANDTDTTTGINDSAGPKPVKELAIQLGAFALKKNALRLQQRLRAIGYHADIFENLIDGKNLLYLVWVGSYPSEEAAKPDLDSIKARIKIEGVARPRSFARGKQP